MITRSVLSPFSYQMMQAPDQAVQEISHPSEHFASHDIGIFKGPVVSETDPPIARRLCDEVVADEFVPGTPPPLYSHSDHFGDVHMPGAPSEAPPGDPTSHPIEQNAGVDDAIFPDPSEDSKKCFV